MPGIYHVYVVLPHMPGIYMVYPWIYHVYPSDSGWIYMVYPWISLDIPCLSIKYIHCISMDIHGISLDVYTWYIRGISRYIHGYTSTHKSKDKSVVMNYNLHVDSIQQIRQKNFEQNPCLINILAKKCGPLGMPSQQGIDHKRD